MADKRDYYEVLGIDKSADATTIKRAYRKLAKKYHPDVNKAPDAEEKFKEVQEAYDVLSDANKKAAYDRYGHAAFDQNGGGAGGFGGGFGGFGGFDDVDLGDIFGSFFGGGQRRQRPTGPRQGEDRFMQLEIDFMDAIKGKKTEIRINFDEPCKTCHGSGAASPQDVETCSRCGGSGTVRMQQRSPFGTVVREAACPDCNGTGKKIKKICPDCKGKGYNNKNITVELTIPAGINTHQQLRVPGKGGRGINGGPNGDLYVEIYVRPHKHFVRQGDNIAIEVPISPADAALGCKVDVPTVYGDVSMTIPEGTQPGATLRLKGKGVKSLRGNTYGDEYVTVKVKVPTKLTKQEKELYKKLQDASKKSSIFDQFKKSFKL
ncbi:molecular chaperone DnaJ [Kandleria vitulina]|nr:molecular chaperone DnaJ [Kandleria vitulina]MEE0988573.1 molecular chaperone DnaJ [Kandleria vitulina]SDL64846.1 molecular chaperone DnaJ [Kandleria vitulina]SEI65339.1 molecular chaperone DnaJ [Kandleria vitulina]